MRGRGVWRSVCQNSGGQFVMTCGAVLMPSLYVYNWDSQNLVSL